MQLFADLNKNSFGLLIHDLDLSKLFYENRQKLQEIAIIYLFKKISKNYVPKVEQFHRRLLN